MNLFLRITFLFIIGFSNCNFSNVQNEHINEEIWIADTINPPVYRFSTQLRVIESMDFSSDGKRLLSGSANSTQEMSVSDSGLKVIMKIRPHKASNSVTHYLPGDQYFVSGSYNEFQIFFRNSAKPIYIYNYEPIEKNNLDIWSKRAWVNGSGDMLMADWHDNVYFYSKKENRVVKKWVGLVDYSPHRTELLNGLKYLYKDKLIKLDSLLVSNEICFSDDLKYILWKPFDGSRDLGWNEIDKSQNIYHISESEPVKGFSFLNNSKQICVITDTHLYILNFETNKKYIANNLAPGQLLNCIAYSKASQKLAVGTEDRDGKSPQIILVNLADYLK